jgi:hypothetical protein
MSTFLSAADSGSFDASFGFERQGVVLDFVFVVLSILFFVVSLGYVAACDRMMK